MDSFGFTFDDCDLDKRPRYHEGETVVVLNLADNGLTIGSFIRFEEPCWIKVMLHHDGEDSHIALVDRSRVRPLMSAAMGNKGA